MLTPDLNLLRRKIGLAPGEDFPWVRDLGFKNTGRGIFSPALGGTEHSVSVRWLRSLLRLSRLDRAIDQRKKSIP